MKSVDIPSEFNDIRPYCDDEIKGAVEALLHDRQFSRMMRGLMPWAPQWLRNGLLRTMFIGVNSTYDFQKRYMKRIVEYVMRKCSTGVSFSPDGIAPGDERYTFISNHRDIVLDSAILDVLLFYKKFPTTCEIAIGDNLLIYPWIRTLVRLNKAFTVRRGLSPRELLASSQLMSRYIHYAVTGKKENLWIAQREGRAKDSNDRTQESLLKMLAIGGEGTLVEKLMDLNITPLTISYEYDPCDYLKAMEFQLKRDVPGWKKSKQDDLDNMKTGIWGQKGRVHYQTAAPINRWLPELKDLEPKAFYAELARRMDLEIHRGYRLFPGNYVAIDMLDGTKDHGAHYTSEEKRTFERYLQSRLDLIKIENKDEVFLRTKILEMYANPVINYEQAIKA